MALAKISYVLGSICFCYLIAGCKDNENSLSETQHVSIDLKDVIDHTKAPPFACGFGKYEVITVPSKHTDYTYFKLEGKGLLINSGWLHTEIYGNPDIIYAVPKPSPIANGVHLSGYCISMKTVPYEGKEREKIDQSAAIVDFYLQERHVPSFGP